MGICLPDAIVETKAGYQEDLHLRVIRDEGVWVPKDTKIGYLWPISPADVAVSDLAAGEAACPRGAQGTRKKQRVSAWCRRLLRKTGQPSIR
jgi:hypothetical protein